MKNSVTKEQRRATKLAVRAERQARREAPVACPVCGAMVSAGQMLDHKWQAHGERQVVPSPAQPRRATWVSVHQGGLPSLGKRSR